MNEHFSALLELFHDPGEFHMVDPIFVHQEVIRQLRGALSMLKDDQIEESLSEDLAG